MVTVEISKNVSGRIVASKHEFKSQRNAFMAAHNAARYFGLIIQIRNSPQKI